MFQQQNLSSTHNLPNIFFHKPKIVLLYLVSCSVPSFQRGTACLWRSARRRRSDPPWWAPGRPGSPGNWSSGWRPCPCSSDRPSGSPSGSYGATRIWRTQRSDAKDLWRETRRSALEQRQRRREEWRLTVLAAGAVHLYDVWVVDLLQQREFWQKVAEFAVRSVFCKRKAAVVLAHPSWFISTSRTVETLVLPLSIFTATVV